MTPKGEVQTERELVAEWLWERDERQAAAISDRYAVEPWSYAKGAIRESYLRDADSLLALSSPRQPPDDFTTHLVDKLQSRLFFIQSYAEGLHAGTLAHNRGCIKGLVLECLRVSGDIRRASTAQQSVEPVAPELDAENERLDVLQGVAAQPAEPKCSLCGTEAKHPKGGPGWDEDDYICEGCADSAEGFEWLTSRSRAAQPRLAADVFAEWEKDPEYQRVKAEMLPELDAENKRLNLLAAQPDEPALEELLQDLHEASHHWSTPPQYQALFSKAWAALAEMEKLRFSLIRMGEHYDKAAARCAELETNRKQGAK